MAYDGILSKDMSSGMRELSGKINKRIMMLENDPYNAEVKKELDMYKRMFLKLKEMHSVNGVYITGRYNYKYKRKRKITDEQINEALNNLPAKDQTNENK